MRNKNWLITYKYEKVSQYFKKTHILKKILTFCYKYKIEGKFDIMISFLLLGLFVGLFWYVSFIEKCLKC